MKQTELPAAGTAGPGGIPHRNEMPLETAPAGAELERLVILSRLRQLEQENRELRRANEILRHAAAYFAGKEPSGR